MSGVAAPPGPFFHGGPGWFAVGDVLLPPMTRGRDTGENCPSSSDPSFVYITPDPWFAMLYTVNYRPDGAVWIVAPDEPVLRDPEHEDDQNWMTRRAVVVEKWRDGIHDVTDLPEIFASLGSA